MSSATAQNLMPVYAPNPSPRVAQGRLVAEQQAQMAQRALQSAPPLLDPRLNAPPTSLPQVQTNGPQHNTLPPVQLNGQMNGIQRTATPPQNTSQPQISTPTSSGRAPSPKGTPQTNGKTSQAQVIPSISSLVHATDSVCVIEDNKSNSSRQGSKSPIAGEAKPAESGDNQQPKDIPHEKLNNMATDVRAIRSLDRSFMI